MATETTRRHWRAPEERHRNVPSPDGPTDSSASDAGATSFRRRGFLKAAGFSLMAAASASCERAPERLALPFPDEPEGVTPGRAMWYASTCGACEAGCGILVKVRDGRPIKVEGNPDHPLNRGGLCAAGQAAVLGLYDGQRYTGPRRAGQPISWTEIDSDLGTRLAALRASGGAVRLLSRTVSSPALQATIDRFLAGFADGRHVTYDALPASAILDAHARTHGRRVLPRYRLDSATVVVGIDADFLGTWVSPVEHTRAYRAGRTLDGTPPRCSYHAQFEGRLSITGSKADRRLRVAPDDEPLVIEQLAARVATRAGVAFDARGGVPAVDSRELDEVASRLWTARGSSLVLAGTPDVAAQVLVNFVNHLLGNYGTTVDIARPSRQRLGDDLALGRCLREMRDGAVAALVVLGANPAYDLPAEFGFDAAAAKVGLKISLAPAPDETSAQADYVCPDHHAFESWSDAEPVAGLAAVVQPAVRPLGSTRAAIETLSVWSGDARPARELVQSHWEREVFPRRLSGNVFEAFWDRTVHDGFVEVAPSSAPSASFDVSVVTPLTPTPRRRLADSLTLVLHANVAMMDGRHAHNPWLQELPDPVSKVTWDNHASLAPATAARLGLASGDVVRIADANGAGSAELTLPVHVQPGQHEGVLAVALGYGRAGTERFTDIGPQWIGAQPGVGATGRVGVNAAPLLSVRDERVHSAARCVTVRPIGSRHELATTQQHHSLVEPHDVSSAGTRPLVVETSLSLLGSAEADASPVERHASLWPNDHPMGAHRWGMVIDLTACTGCSACVVACQAENNIPVVGRDEVRRHREMHWMRIDRYYSDAGDDVDVVHQPMLCQQCENAPCESVCPVLATVHSDEGLNEQVYNRCVGTRYCANNCAYKVRRFNWFTYAHPDERANLVLNPDVTVRTRGVMEKCSFCVQRIQEARIVSKGLGQPMKDGAVRTACEQSCPAGAIVFGDLNDPASRVSVLARSGRRFRVLEELDLRPSVTYLSVVRNRAAGDTEERHG